MKICRVHALAAALFVLTPLRAQIFESYSFSPNVPIPDGNATGVSDARTISSAGTSISSLTVKLNISGEFNGDLYVYLRHSTGFSILLNQPGVTAGDSFGYDDQGLDITLRDAAAHDVHFYRDFTTTTPGQPVTGEWQPDGRDGDPATASRSAFLNSFEGLDPNGQWTLLAADLQNGGTSQLQTWGMEMTVVPEPRQFAFAGGAALLVFGLWRRLRAR